MANDAPTIAETITKIQGALREYIEATYHIGHPTLVEQRRELLDEEGVIYQAPFIESTQRYQTNRRFAELELDPAAHALFASLTSNAQGSPLLYDPPYTHQAEALELTTRDSLSLAVTTGTGSGKTETFLLPMMAKLAAEAAHHPKSFARPAVRALILYPMNALVNDQLGRLRLLLGDPRVTGQFESWAGRPVRFARYTSRTLYPGVRKVERDQQRLKSVEDFYIDLLDRGDDPGARHHVEAAALIDKLKERGKWPAKPDLRTWYGDKGSRWKRDGEFVRAVTQPQDAELLTRHEVLAAPPDVLITNYSMLEYMLMRPLERPVFDATRQWLADNPEERFLLIVDEAHLYRGAAGAEVALLLRRLRARLGISADRLQVIATSASFNDAAYASTFAAQLTGKDEGEFRTIEGKRALRAPAAPGSVADAVLLAGLPLDEFYDGEKDVERIASVKDLLDARGATASPGDSIGALLVGALSTYEPMNLLVNETMQRAQPVSELGAVIFPDADAETADRAVTALVALGSAARVKADDAGLLPCRVHAFYRGLPGLWACADDECSAVDRAAHPAPGPVGKLYAQPQETCSCGARVFEFYTCRSCGTAYLRAYTDDVTTPSALWHEPGNSYQGAKGAVWELHPIDLLVEEPDPDRAAEKADLDLVTGRLNPNKLGPRCRSVYLPGKRDGSTVATDDDDDDGATTQTSASGEFKPCGVCGKTAGYNRSSVQDHQTKGDQPFQALVTRQIEVQPPSRPYSDFAPLRGRKVLAFSDSRQVAARLAPNLQKYAMQDVMRPLIVRGWRELVSLPGITKQLNLEHLTLATMVGAKRLSVRLRPELRRNESMKPLTDVSRVIDAGALDGDEEARTELMMMQPATPEALLKAIYATLTDRYYGLAALGLASLRERTSLRQELLDELPNIPGIADSDERKIALVRLWLTQWSTPSYGIWFPTMPGDWRGIKEGVRPHSGSFSAIKKWLGPAASKTFARDWLPILRDKFCEAAGNKSFLLAKTVALELDGEWGYCDHCRSTQRPFPGSTKCINCGADEVRTLDPENDVVFQARKGYYRASTVRALSDPPEPPMSIIAAEHTAQLNAAQSEAVFSKAEEHELLFQDVDVELPAGGAQDRAAIDVLSCTTTMEVGIDIGALSGVALRNMPPSRANYQQRAGRAGRRGNAVATVVAFGSSDTHDDHYFREPAEMIRGNVVDPILTMDNEEIAQRHVTAYLFQRYHQDRLPSFDPEAPSQLFEVLGTVRDFTGTTAPLNRTDFEKWLRANEAALKVDIDDWLPDLTPASRAAILAGIVPKTLSVVDEALDLTPAGELPAPAEGDLSPEADEAEAEGPTEDGAEEPSPERSQTNLLDRLLYKGVLPRYAFPTDVASFHVFDVDKSEQFRAAFRYAPSQGLPVALSQYAPGKVVWIDNKEWRSGAIYSPVRAERKKAWENHKLYFECRVCHYADYFDKDKAHPGDERECPACGSEDTFGKAMAWMRPPGFAHPAYEDEGTSPDDAPARSYATRAKLIAPGPEEESAWHSVSERVQQTYHREPLIVTNTGPRNEGYTYCFQCGRIEPTATPTGTVVGQHKKPYPDEKEPDCPGSMSWKGLVLGTDFITDVLLVRFNVKAPVRLSPQLLATQVALRTIAEAMTIAATQMLDIEATELQAEYRPALTAGGAAGLEAEIYLYDTLAGGAGFTRRVEQLGVSVLQETLKRLEECPADCDQSCYRCIRSFRNRFEHGLLDRKVGASLLRYLLYGTAPRLDTARLELSTTRLFNDLEGRGISGVSFARDAVVNIAGIGKVTAPILATKGDRQFIFGVHGSLTPHLAPDPVLNDAKENQLTIPVRLIDDIEISRSLPNASLEVEKALA